MDIQPGTTITVEIKATPRGEAATKTLHRVCRKDPDVARRLRWQDRHRPSLTQKQRGGRFWDHRMKSTSGVALNPGSRYSLQATVDVIRDLESVARWVRVSAG